MHTPTPWQVWQSPDGIWMAKSVYRDASDRRCTCWPATFACGAQDSKANAEFAVRAVNSHADLVACLKAAIALLDDCEIAHPFAWDAALLAAQPNTGE